MNKTELIKAVTHRSGVSAKEVSEVLNAITETITEQNQLGNEVLIKGFGNFKVIERKAKKAMDFSRGKVIDVPSKKVAKFVPFYKAEA